MLFVFFGQLTDDTDWHFVSLAENLQSLVVCCADLLQFHGGGSPLLQLEPVRGDLECQVDGRPVRDLQPAADGALTSALALPEFLQAHLAAAVSTQEGDRVSEHLTAQGTHKGLFGLEKGLHVCSSAEVKQYS